MNKSTIILTIIIILLLSCNVYFCVKLFTVQKQLNALLGKNQINSKIVAFNKLFVDKVLTTQGEVSFEDRLKLENAAVGTGDKEIIDAWHNFLNSQTEAQAQDGTKKLLSLFANKIIY